MSTRHLFARFQYARLPLRLAEPHRPLLEQLDDALRLAPTATSTATAKIPDNTPLCHAVQSIESTFYHLDRPYQLNIFVRSSDPPTVLQARCWVAENPLTRALLTFTLLESAADAAVVPAGTAPTPVFWERLADFDVLEQQLPSGALPAFQLTHHLR